MRRPETKPAWGRTERGIALTSFCLVTLLIGVFLLRDASAFVNSAQAELLGHLGASAGFTLAGTGAFIAHQGRRPALATILLGGAVLTVLGELAQALAPTRGVELRDITTGLAGVLLTGLLIETLFAFVSLGRALRVHTVAASVASLALCLMLIVDLTPQTVSDALPNGESCPLTSLDGSGERVIVGDEPLVVNGCLETAVGGFSLFGPDNVNALADESVLVSSPLTGLAESIMAARTVTLRAEFLTEAFDEDDDVAPGVIAMLRSREVGQVFQIRTRMDRVEVFGPTTGSSLRSVAFSRTLSPATRHQLEIQFTANELIVQLDGANIATVAMGDGWTEPLEDAIAEGDLILFLANHSNRTLPFNGVIEWIEIET